MLYKKLYKNISVVALGTALFSLPVFTACESDVVDLEPVDKFSGAYGIRDRRTLRVSRSRSLRCRTMWYVRRSE